MRPRPRQPLGEVEEEGEVAEGEGEGDVHIREGEVEATGPTRVGMGTGGMVGPEEAEEGMVGEVATNPNLTSKPYIIGFFPLILTLLFCTCFPATTREIIR